MTAGLTAPPSRRRLTFAAAACLLLVAYLALYNVGLRYRQKADDMAELGNRARDLMISARIYAFDNGGLYPPLDLASHHFTFAEASVRDAFEVGSRLGGINDVVNPGSSPLEDAGHFSAVLFRTSHTVRAYTLHPMYELKRYFYLGFAVTDEKCTLTLMSRFKTLPNAPAGASEDLEVSPGTGTFGSDRIYRLREDLAESLAKTLPGDRVNTRSAAQIPVVVENPAFNDGKGGWVVYLDRDARYLSYPGPFPMTERFIQALQATLQD